MCVTSTAQPSRFLPFRERRVVSHHSESAPASGCPSVKLGESRRTYGFRCVERDDVSDRRLHPGGLRLLPQCILSQEHVFVLLAELVLELATQPPLLKPVERGDSP